MNISLIKYNRHWDKKYIYPYPKKRDIFPSIIALIKNRQIIELIGLRRVGKSTLMFQVINELIIDGFDPYHVLYFSFDEFQPILDSLFSMYEEQTSIDYKNKKIIVFLDEIQKLDNFQNQIKVIYDLYPNIKFVLSGSTSLFIKKKTQESLAGRIFSFFITPLSFKEYLYFKDKNEILLKPKLYKTELEKEFNIFLESQFIESLFMDTISEKKQYYLSIIRKIIFEDMPTVFHFDNPQILYRIVQYIAQKPGCLINNVKLAQELQISNKTVALYLSYLEEAFIIKKYYNFSRNLISSEKRLKKYYLMSPSFTTALVDFVDRSALFENYIASCSFFRYFFRDAYMHEVDFIQINNDSKIFPIEAKWKYELDNQDLKSLLIFMNKYSIDKGIVIYKGIEKKKIIRNKKEITLLPYYSEIL